MADVPNDAELQRLGLYDPDAPDAADRRQVVRRLFELGGAAEEGVEAIGTGRENDLAMDLAMRPPGRTRTLDEFVASSDIDSDLVRRLWSALGLPASGPVKVTPDAADALELLAGMAALFKPETAYALARVMGSTSTRLA